MTKPVKAALLSCSGPRLTEAERRLFADTNPLGLTLFSRNIENRQQLSALITSIKESIGREDVIIAIDQEGGRVRRLAEPIWPAYASQIDLGRLPLPEAVAAVRLHARLISADLRELGINLNFAPVLDLIYPQTCPAIKSRCFSASELVVATLGKAMIEEYIDNSICPCIKHLPGHGRAAVDPHLDLPQIDCSLTELERDLYPFYCCRHAPAGMSAHIIIKALDPQHPVTQSPAAIRDLIRGRIGFDGLLISDAIDMHALKGTLAEKAEAALTAGCDCICYALGETNQMEQFVRTCPQLTDTAQDRFDRIRKLQQQKPLIRATPEDLKEYRNLSGMIEPYCEDYDATEVLNKLKHKGEK